MSAATASSNTAALMAGGALLVAGLGYWTMSSSATTSKSKSRGLGDIDEIDDAAVGIVDPADYISEKEVIQFFDQLLLEMNAVLSNIMQQLQAIQMSGQFPESQLKNILCSEMERALTVKQKLLVDQMNMDYDCLEEATWEFLKEEEKHPQVKKAVDKFQRFWESVSGEAVTGWRPGKEMVEETDMELLDPTKLVEVADAYFSSLSNQMKKLIEERKSNGENIQDAAIAKALHKDFTDTANDAGEACLKGYGVTLRQFEMSIKKHASDPTVGRALAGFQMRQQQELMAMGSS